MGAREDFEAKVTAQLDEYKAEIDKLKAKADKAEADAKLEYQQQLESLRAKHDEAQQKLNELKNAGDTAWKDLQAGVERAWNTLGDAVDAAASRFS